jgi:hypothetical protein
MCDTGCRLAGTQVLAGPYLSQQRDPYCLCQRRVVVAALAPCEMLSHVLVGSKLGTYGCVMEDVQPVHFWRR